MPLTCKTSTPLSINSWLRFDYLSSTQSRQTAGTSLFFQMIFFVFTQTSRANNNGDAGALCVLLPGVSPEGASSSPQQEFSSPVLFHSFRGPFDYCCCCRRRPPTCWR